MTKYIVAVGDIGAGFSMFGPFDNEDEARTFYEKKIQTGQYSGGDWYALMEPGKMTPCEGCHGKRYRLGTRADGLLAIERCDTCSKFASDEEARNHVVENNLLPGTWEVEPDAPCYVYIKVEGSRYRLAHDAKVGEP